MIPREKIRNILERLLEKTRLNQVNWQQNPTRYLDEDEEGDSTTKIERFAVLFPESSIEVQYWSPATEPDYIVIEIRNKSDAVVDTIAIDDDDDDWQLASDLFREVERFVLGSDEVLNDIENAIRREGTIGLPPA